MNNEPKKNQSHSANVDHKNKAQHGRRKRHSGRAPKFEDVIKKDSQGGARNSK